MLLDFAVLASSDSAMAKQQDWADVKATLRPNSLDSLASDGRDSPVARGESSPVPFESIAHAESAAAVGSLLAFERAMAAVRRRAATGEGGRIATPAQQVVSFMRYTFGTVAAESGSADPLVTGVQQLCKQRDAAARMRAAGIAHIADTLEQATAAGDEGALSRALLILAVAIRSARSNSLLAQARKGESDESVPIITAIHGLAGLDGCSPDARKAVYAAMLRCMKVAIAVLQAASAGLGTESKSKMESCRAALMVLAQDYNIGDIPLLHATRLLPTVRALLSGADKLAVGGDADASAGVSESKGEEVSANATQDSKTAAD